jgi:hypothetical protein
MRKHSALQYLSPSEYEFDEKNLSLAKAALPMAAHLFTPHLNQADNFI